MLISKFLKMESKSIILKMNELLSSVDNYERKSSSIQVIDDQNNVETVNADR